MLYRTIDGGTVPALGFGTYHLTGPEGLDAIRYALDVGYRYIDTAARYENEYEVGRALAESGLNRAEFFIATKIRHTDLDPAHIERRVEESLARLNVDQVDLLMPHWPSADIPVPALMSALARIRDKGYCRHIGLSNFPTKEMNEAVSAFDGQIFANQIEYHPFLDQSVVLDQLRAHGILLTASLPLARGAVDSSPQITAIAAAHGKTPAQVALRWLVQQEGVCAIPKSAQHGRIRQNFEIFDFVLSGEEMALIDASKCNRRLLKTSWAPRWDA